MQLIDTHTHLTMKEYKNNLQEVLGRAQQAGVENWVTIGTNLADSARGIELSRDNSGLLATVGVHPHEAAQQEPGWQEALRALAGNNCVRAIGEAGLDYYYEHSDRNSQQKVFAEQLEIAGRLKLPVVIHCRDAMEDCLGILKDFNSQEMPVVFHCFSGDVKQAKQLLDREYYISFTGNITFKKNDDLRRTAEYVPLARVMLETDCPYLSPEPKRKVKPNEPALLAFIAARLAQIRRIDYKEVAEVTTKTGKWFFGINL